MMISRSFGRVWMTLATIALMLASLVVPAVAGDKDDIEKVVEILVTAFRTGDYDLLEPYLDDKIVIVPVVFTEPMEGKEIVLESYKAQQQAFQASEMSREGTRIHRQGKVAWVSYRWEYAANYEGRLFSFRGHTTLVLRKRGKRWLIVHNHTSALPSNEPPPSS